MLEIHKRVFIIIFNVVWISFVMAVNHVLIVTAVVLILNSNVGDVKFGKQEFMDRFLDAFCLTDPDVRYKVNMAFEMNILIAQVPGMYMMNVVNAADVFKGMFHFIQVEAVRGGLH